MTTATAEPTLFQPFLEAGLKHRGLFDLRQYDVDTLDYVFFYSYGVLIRMTPVNIDSRVWRCRVWSRRDKWPYDSNLASLALLIAAETDEPEVEHVIRLNIPQKAETDEEDRIWETFCSVRAFGRYAAGTDPLGKEFTILK